MSTSKPFCIHNGVQIFLTPAGSFSADVNGKSENRPSVAAIKKLIEKKATFEPFVVIDEDRGYSDSKGKIRERTITGAKKNNRSRSWSANVWLDNTGHEHTTVFPDTPDNRAALQAVIDKRFEIAGIEKKLAEELSALERKLVRRNLDAEIKRADADKIRAANGSDPLVVGDVYRCDHSRKGVFVIKLTSIGDDMVSGEIVSGEAHMLANANENATAGDSISIRESLAKWTRLTTA